VLVAYQDFLLTTWNPSPPVDTGSEDRNESTFFNPKSTTVQHPSAVDPREVIHDEHILNSLYCQSCNVQSHHKHQAYCDENHTKREVHQEKFRKKESGAIDPATIPVKCRFSYPFPLLNKSCVLVEQKLSKGSLIT
jgi:hypothetical protein